MSLGINGVNSEVGGNALETAILGLREMGYKKLDEVMCFVKDP